MLIVRVMGQPRVNIHFTRETTRTLLAAMIFFFFFHRVEEPTQRMSAAYSPPSPLINTRFAILEPPRS